MSRSAVAAEPGLENGHGPFSYTFTPPPSHVRSNYSSSTSSITHMQSRSGSQFSTFSQPSRSSASTQGTSASTLVESVRTSTPLQSNGSFVNASNNVINRVAEKETSLFQICVNLRNRLKGVPGFEDQLLEVEETDGEGDDEERDPVSILWNTFRRGYPLMTIYNALQPQVPLSVDESRVPEARRQKTAAFKFLQACVNELKFPTDECFIITDLYGEDTSGFVKVAKVVNRVADILVQKGLLETYSEDSDGQGATPFGKRTHREHIVDELVRTERTYVQHLEVLQAFKKLVEQRGVISGDAIHDIFLNLNALLDFQRRFLIRVEQINNAPEPQQNWGALFQSFARGFGVYEPYIANQRKCEETAMREYEKLRTAGGPVELRQLVESPTHLTSFLLKPFQRLSKYPLLLKELRDKGDLDEMLQNDISRGMETISGVLDRTNAFIDREERMQAVRFLKESVDDWKNHAFEGFGELLLHGTHTVIKGDTTQSEKVYQMYLFEKILLCCKEANPNKQKNRLMKQAAPLQEKPGRSKLILKGRIFMQNVTETIFLAKPGSYTCQIHWRGDEAIEYFIIRFATEETMKKWAQQIETQRRLCKDQAQQAQQQGTSETEFNWVRDQGQLANPYVEDGYLDGDLNDPAAYGYPDFGDYASRNGSSSSLRSRSTTGESAAPAVQPQPRGASLKQPPGMAGPALTLRTQQLQNTGISPGDRAGNSYFSPGAESPISSRTSTSSFNLGFPRQVAPPPGWQNDEHNRFTAPAVGRTTAKDGYFPVDPRNGKAINGHSYPVHPASLSQTRMRSASSPDIHTQNAARSRAASNAPPVPSLPPHLAQPGPLDRSQSNSPIYPNNIPPRVTSQSPTARRQMSNQQSVHSSHHPQFSVDSASILSADAPSQIKVKVKVPSEGSTMTLVVGFNISFQSLKDRIDAKLQRHTNLSLAAGSVKLKYLSDDDYVSIQTDEDVQTAFDTWREQQQDLVAPSQMEEIELYCLR